MQIEQPTAIGQKLHRLLVPGPANHRRQIVIDKEGV